MIIKTESFDRKFNDDLHWITLNRKLPLWYKGSYKVKDWGDIITDIDLTARVYYNTKLLEIISGLLARNRKYNSPFKFIHMAVGKYQGYQLPWIIDDNGGCNFDLDKARIWFEWFKEQGMVPDSVLVYIETRLYSSILTIRNIIDIENAIHPYSEIVWGEKDIRNGYIRKDNIVYNLLDEMKTETPVLEFVYKYEDKYIVIDVGLVDRNFKVPPAGPMYRYYMQDWYKIMKGFRWKIEERYRPQYFTDMNKINTLIALKYQIEFIQKIENRKDILSRAEIMRVKKDIYNVMKKIIKLDRTMSSDDILYQITEKVNNYLRDKVMRYADLVTPVERNEIRLRLYRGGEAQIPTSEEMLRYRTMNGIECPFFSTNMNEFTQLVDIALRSDIHPGKMISCFTKISEKLNKPIRNVMNEVLTTTALSIITKDDRIVLYDSNIEKGTFSLKDKPKLQIQILTGNIFYNK